MFFVGGFCAPTRFESELLDLYPSALTAVKLDYSSWIYRKGSVIENYVLDLVFARGFKLNRAFDCLFVC